MNNKVILSPGNGVVNPKKGEYVKLNLLIYNSKKEVYFDSKNTYGFMIRYKMGIYCLITYYYYYIIFI